MMVSTVLTWFYRTERQGRCRCGTWYGTAAASERSNVRGKFSSTTLCEECSPSRLSSDILYVDWYLVAINLPASMLSRYHVASKRGADIVASVQLSLFTLVPSYYNTFSTVSANADIKSVLSEMNQRAATLEPQGQRSSPCSYPYSEILVPVTAVVRPISKFILKYNINTRINTYRKL